jgi:hypothetical protein
MRNSLQFLVLLLTSMFGVSLLLPAQDVLETPYDESESLPLENTPVFSIQAPSFTSTVPANLSMSPMATAMPRERLSIGERLYRPSLRYEPTFLCTLLC